MYSDDYAYSVWSETIHRCLEMVATKGGMTVRFRPRPKDPGEGARAEYGEAMRVHRERAGMSLAVCATHLGYDTSALSRFETAQRAIPPDLPRKLDDLFGTVEMFATMYLMIQHDVHPGRYRQIMEFETQAVRISEYAAAVVPGLLQTLDYARALLRTGLPDASDDEIEEKASLRIARQVILTEDDPPMYSVVLDEAVLRRPIGGHDVTYAQFEKLLPLVDSPRVTVRVYPFERGEHPVLGGSLTLLTLPDGKVGAWLEGSNSGQMIEDPETVRERQRSYDRLSAWALSPGESASMITAAMKEYGP
ncbi:helix-turn-helix domain-containing protein [Embleya sp. AB8]|uniref:helix-turn-helix domain-containing protein n=1 Tax=Embleya sp. AB8 TaxID=3156304 RepID=UPI003C744518